MEKGLWQNSRAPDSSPISYMGKSTIQHRAYCLLVKVAGDPLAQHGADNAGGLLGGSLLAGGHADEGAGLQIQLLSQGRGAVTQELGNAAGESAVLVYLEPAGLVAGLDFHISQKLVDPFPGLGEVVHADRLDGSALEGAEAAALDKVGNILDLQVQIRRSGLSEP